MRDTTTISAAAADLPPAAPRAQDPAAPGHDAPPRHDDPFAARAAARRAEAGEARAALAAGAPARRADLESARQRLMEERRRRNADPAERPAREAALARAAARRADAEEARAALAAGAPGRAAERERLRRRNTEERRRRRDADPAGHAARDEVLPRVRREADEARASLRHRLAAAPGARRTSPQRRWEPLSDDEWAVLSPFVARAAGCPGRPARDPRARLDAIFWLAARPQRHLPPWRELPEALFGKRDTVARQFRRWAHAGLWTRLLEALADPDRPGIAVLRRLESWLCRTYRRAWRLLGVRGVVLARRLGFLSALRAPSVLLPDPHLSHSVKTRLAALRDCWREKGEAAMRAMLPCPDYFQAANALLRNATGGRRISRHMAWP